MCRYDLNPVKKCVANEFQHPWCRLPLWASAIILICSLSSNARGQDLGSNGLPPGFVYADSVIPALQVELRYLSSNNFIGVPIDGYQASRVITTSLAASALAGVQADLRPFGLGLKVFDAYRPQSAVDHFVRWASDLSDTTMRTAYYPQVSKDRLFAEGYIAARSGHSRGSTVDLTVVDLREGSNPELDMGSPYDFFGVESWPLHEDLTQIQRSNRMMLRSVMVHHGFRPYEKEWWHFTLVREPFPNRYFEFPVR